MDHKISERRIVNIVSRFLDGTRGNVEHIKISNGISGLKDIYIVPVGTGTGRFFIMPNVIRAKLVTPDGATEFMEVAVKHHTTGVKATDAQTLMAPTIASSPTNDRNVKLAVQMWMPDSTAEEYLMEVAKVLAFWKHLISKDPRRKHVAALTDIRPENIKKWAIDLHVSHRDNARIWNMIALDEFLKEYGEDGINTFKRLAKIAGLKENRIEDAVRKMHMGKIDNDVLRAFMQMFVRLPRTNEFWEHHAKKNMEILQGAENAWKATGGRGIPKRRKEILLQMTKHLRAGRKNDVKTALLNLAELERDIVAEMVAAYKYALRKYGAEKNG